METAPRKVIARNRPTSGVILLGLFLVISGLFVQDSMGVNLIVTGLGIALLIAGISYIATKGKGRVALTNAFVSLVAAQLLAFNGMIRLIGGLTIIAVVVSIIYSRLW